jgi:uncharacterized membrane protein
MLAASCVYDDLEQKPVTRPGSYFGQVKEIVKNNCIQCHSISGNGTPKGLPTTFETDDDIANLAEPIKATTNDPVSPRNKRMPYGGELSDHDKDIIVKWYQAGGTKDN